MTKIIDWLSSAPFLHLAGIIAISVLLGVGVVSVTEGFPILTGLVGLGITTSSSVSSTQGGTTEK